MNTQQPNELNQVRDIIWEIEDKSASGDYIFRGEPECYPKVSSTLYRQYRKILGDDFDVEVVQTGMLREGKEYLLGPIGDFELLTELQHYGGKTNLIDFTTDSRVALFFACDGSPGKKGRVILRKKGDREDLVENSLREPSNPLNRVIAQKSVFVRPRRGFVEFNQDKDVVEIPAALKKPMLEYLHKYHNISAKTIYNDLHGFIRTQDIHHKAYEEFYRGLSAEDKGELDEAIQNYDKAIQLKPDLFEAYNNRGIIYSKKREFNKAIQNYDKAIEINPDSVEAYNNRGIAYREKREFNKAIQNYDKAIEINPDSVEAYNNRGNAYRQKGDFDNAIKDFTKTIEIKPDSATAYYNRGDAYRQKGDFDNAIKDFTTALELNPVYADAYSNRATAYFQKGDFDNAIKDLTKTIEIKPDDFGVYNNSGVAYGKKGEFDKAIQNYDKAIELKPDFAKAYSNRGEAWMHLGEWNKAKADLTVAKDSGVDIIASFHSNYENVADFEEKNGIAVPADIKEMLTPA